MSNASAWLIRLAAGQSVRGGDGLLAKIRGQKSVVLLILRERLSPISDTLMPANALERSEWGSRIRNVLDSCYDVCGRYGFPVIRYQMGSVYTVYGKRLASAWPARNRTRIRARY
jgi:hypothetical protein